MKKIIRDYFTFNRRERNGVIVLLGIIFCFIVYLNISHHFVTEEEVDFKPFDKEIAAMRSSQPDVPHDPEKVESRAGQSFREVSYFEFDPNVLQDADWMRLGLSPKQIRSIRKYQARGGRFRSIKDVEKMYCIPPEQYALLEPWIRIPAEQSKMHADAKTLKVAEEHGASLLELNGADSSALMKVKGIGPFFAKNILKYRRQLGGFYSKEQLLEVWKFDEEKYEALKDLVVVDAGSVKKININTCTAEMLKHPYLRWNAAKAIVSYRENHGPYQRLEDIRKTDLVDEETYRKIVPYLTLD